jgi:hypothetical protein
MTGGQPPRDWDKELAQIDKLIAASGKSAGAGAQTPAAPAAPGAAAPRVARAPAVQEGAPRRRSVVFTWLRLALGVAITQWPYVRGCGPPLFGYLVAVGGVIVAGLWSAVSSWRSRSSLAHALSIALFCWGGVLAAREVLPRVGYARTSAHWFCPVPATTPSTPSKPQGAF